ncbi:MAG: filamentous hemagglutinin N-terminal domain-containing protein, partial [Oscillatoriales cyanobacterium]
MKSKISFGVLLALLGSAVPVEAQIVTDGRLETIVTPQENQFAIEGGQRSDDGVNLFHSFATFDLEAGQVANFVTTPNIQNVLGRVTGGEVSSIDGLIQVTGSNADLFLLNPAGIIFGENARLDVAGDFTATTAGAIEFESGWFAGLGEVNGSALGGEPIAFDFSGLDSGAIVNFGELAVADDANLNLFGGTVLNGGSLSGGNVSVTAIGGGQTLQLSAAGNVLGLEVATERVVGAGITPIALPELLTGGNLASAGSLDVVDGVVRLSGAEVLVGDSVVTGAIDVSSENVGGVVQVLGDRVVLSGASLDVTGELGGGSVYLGGDYRGGGTLPTATTTVVDPASVINASAIASGHGGEVIVWADDMAGFFGQILARGGAFGGDGGFVETSGAGSLVFRGGVDVSAPLG